MTAIAVPSTGGMQSSLADYGVGAIAGLIHQFATGITGNGMIGGAVAAAAVGSMVRGPRGQIITTTLGYNSLLFSGIFGGGGNPLGDMFSGVLGSFGGGGGGDTGPEMI